MPCAIVVATADWNATQKCLYRKGCIASRVLDCEADVPRWQSKHEPYKAEMRQEAVEKLVEGGKAQPMAARQINSILASRASARRAIADSLQLCIMAAGKSRGAPQCSRTICAQATQRSRRAAGPYHVGLDMEAFIDNDASCARSQEGRFRHVNPRKVVPRRAPPDARLNIFTNVCSAPCLCTGSKCRKKRVREKSKNDNHRTIDAWHQKIRTPLCTYKWRSTAITSKRWRPYRT